MSNDKIVAPLLRVPIFSRLSAAQIDEIARHTERLCFHDGDLITAAGQPGDGAFLVVSGTVEEASAAGPQEVPSDALIGEMAMLIEHDYTVTTIARDRVLCLKIARSALRAQMTADPSLADLLAQHIAQRLLRFTEELRRIEGSSHPDRQMARGGSAQATGTGDQPPPRFQHR